MANSNKAKLFTIRQVLNNYFFNKGFNDFVEGRGYDPEYDKWFYYRKEGINCQQFYERGRHYAAATNGEVPPKQGRSVNRRAERVLNQLVYEKAII
jgi:hypothetical protein